TKLLLAPGISQVYYGDETARSLDIPGTQGDATLRSMMNWNELKNSTYRQAVLEHWQKLGNFRKNHPAVGAGVHQQIAATPYTFSRIYQNGAYSDTVVIALDVTTGEKTIETGQTFPEGTILRDAYSGKTATVKKGKVSLNTDYMIVLLEKK
ncbi:MAG: alpha-amylase, partial [Flavobacterium stagni]